METVPLVGKYKVTVALAESLVEHKETIALALHLVYEVRQLTRAGFGIRVGGGAGSSKQGGPGDGTQVGVGGGAGREVECCV